MFDCIIRGGTVIDGSGSAGRLADVAVSDGRVAAVGEVEGGAARVIDASGRVVTPGFIDMHSHTDSGLLVDPRAESKITQGVTLEVCGNCGFSPGPCLDEAGRAEQISWRERHGIASDWQTMGEFLSVMESRPIGVNFLTLVGHANLRAAAVGLANKKATRGQVWQMRKLAAQAMEEGAYGLSSGLIYAPSCFGTTDELAQVAAATAPYGGIYASHIRSEREAIVDAVREAIQIGEQGGVAVQIAHHKACGSRNWGKVRKTLQIIEQARAAGTDVTVDQYPYVASATSLSILLPDWAHDGGDKAALECIRTRRHDLLSYLQAASRPGGWIAGDGGFAGVVVSSVHTDANRHYEGRNMLSIAEERGASPEEAVLDVLLEEEMGVGMVHFAQCEEDIATVMRSPWAAIGTDASARSTTGKLSKGKPHPRSFGTFPRVLGRYVREQGVIGLEEAIRKMTSLPASKFRLADRGLLRQGSWADMVVFDPDAIIDTATYEHPHSTSTGIDFVFVNGIIAVEAGEMTGELPGKVLRRGRD